MSKMIALIVATNDPSENFGMIGANLQTCGSGNLHLGQHFPEVVGITAMQFRRNDAYVLAAPQVRSDRPLVVPLAKERIDPDPGGSFVECWFGFVFALSRIERKPGSLI